jgi:hypothetical protein
MKFLSMREKRGEIIALYLRKTIHLGGVTHNQPAKSPSAGQLGDETCVPNDGKREKLWLS